MAKGGQSSRDGGKQTLIVAAPNKIMFANRDLYIATYE